MERYAVDFGTSNTVVARWNFAREEPQLDYMKGLTEKREEAAGEHETGKTGTKGIDD